MVHVIEDEVYFECGWGSPAEYTARGETPSNFVDSAYAMHTEPLFMQVRNNI